MTIINYTEEDTAVEASPTLVNIAVHLHNIEAVSPTVMLDNSDPHHAHLTWKDERVAFTLASHGDTGLFTLTARWSGAEIMKQKFTDVTVDSLFADYNPVQWKDAYQAERDEVFHEIIATATRIELACKALKSE